MSRNETRILVFLSSAGFGLGAVGMSSLSKDERRLAFMIVLIGTMFMVKSLVDSYNTRKALEQDDADELATLARVAAMYGAQGRGAQVVVQPQRQQTYQQPPAFYQQPAQLPQGMPIEQRDVNIGG